MTNDINSVDGLLVQMFENVITLALMLVIDLISAVTFVPLFTLPGLFIAGIGFYIGSMYLKAQLSVKREMRYDIVSCLLLPHMTQKLSAMQRHQC